jgi:hemin uptake protein HemP
MTTQTHIVVLDESGTKHTVLAEGAKLDKSILDLAGGSVSFDPTTGNLSVTFVDGNVSTVNLSSLVGGPGIVNIEYNSANYVLRFTMTDGSTRDVSLWDIAPTKVVSSNTAGLSGMGTPDDPLKVDVFVAGDTDNQLVARASGLFVPPPPPLDLPTNPGPAAITNETIPNAIVTNTGGQATMLLGDPAGWAIITIGGVSKRIPYWD